MSIQDILDQLELQVKYETVIERPDFSLSEYVTAYATISRKSDGAVVTKLKTVQLHLIERVVERFLEAFAMGYAYARRSAQ